jgi:hypothetical protein
MIVLSGLLNSLSIYCLQEEVSPFDALKHQFLLSPVSAQAHVKRNRSEKPLRSRTQPRIICDLHLEEVPLSLTDVSYKYVWLKLIIEPNTTFYFVVFKSVVNHELWLPVLVTFVNFMSVKNDCIKVKLNYLTKGRWAWYTYIYIYVYIFSVYVKCLN